MLRRCVYLLLMIGLFLVGAFSVWSSSSIEPLFTYTGEYIGIDETIWSPDSQSLVFTDKPFGEQRFYRYNLSVDALQQLAHSPFTVKLTNQQRQRLDAADKQAYISPDGRYVIYSYVEKICRRGVYSNRIKECWHKLALGNLESGESVIIDTNRVDSGRWFIWSDNGNTLLLITSGMGISNVVYITDYADRIEDTRKNWLMNMHSGNDAYVDMSADGQRVLLREQFDGHDTGLYVWDSASPLPEQGFAAAESPLIFEDEAVKGAAFLPGSDDVIAVTNAGIVRLNMQNGERSVVNPRINAQWVEWSYFSPDGQFIAVLDRGTGAAYGKCRLFVLPVDFSGDVESMRAGTERCLFYG